MSRRREESPLDIYHVTSRGTAHQIIFEDDSDRECLLSSMTRLSREYAIELYAWCFMSNHIHLLIHAPIERMSEFMRSLLAAYARQFNRRRERSGHVFEGRYGSEPIDTDEYLIAAIRYIHQNPEVAGVAPTDAYRWSSYGEYIGRQPDNKIPPVCAKAFPLEVFGSLSSFIQLHQKLVDIVEQDSCMMRNSFRTDPDESALAFATELIGMNPSDLKTLALPARNNLLRQLRRAGISIRVIERLTGIGRGVISRIPITT